MNIHIEGVIAPEAITRVRSLLDQGSFRDGKLANAIETEPGEDREEPKDSGIRMVSELNRIVVGALAMDQEVRYATLPRMIGSAVYTRFREGMQFGPHLDKPIMGNRNQYRSDIAITVFLNAPEEYEGGELILHTPFGPNRFKLPAGDVLVYPASFPHQVARVQSGERLAAVAWLQSLVRSYEQRHLLFQLGRVRERLLQADSASAEAGVLGQIYGSLVRTWSEI